MIVLKVNKKDTKTNLVDVIPAPYLFRGKKVSGFVRRSLLDSHYKNSNGVSIFVMIPQVTDDNSTE